jgi:hypothetical protein
VKAVGDGGEDADGRVHRAETEVGLPVQAHGKLHEARVVVRISVLEVRLGDEDEDHAVGRDGLVSCKARIEVLRAPALALQRLLERLLVLVQNKASPRLWVAEHVAQVLHEELVLSRDLAERALPLRGDLKEADGVLGLLAVNVVDDVEVLR